MSQVAMTVYSGLDNSMATNGGEWDIGVSINDSTYHTRFPDRWCWVFTDYETGLGNNYLVTIHDTFRDGEFYNMIIVHSFTHW